MPTENERRALWFLAVVALSGSVVRLVRGRHPDHGPDAGLDRQLARVDSARERRGSERRGRVERQPRTAESREPKAESPVDIDRANADELERLPGIGPALAARIVANRDSIGPFGSPDALCRVRGVGKALVDRLRPLVTASGPSARVSAACGGASTTPRKTRAPSHAKRP